MAFSDSPIGTVVFSTVGRCFYGFDIFSVSLAAVEERRLTDGKSINFNGNFADDDQALVFLSERSGSPRIYLTRPGSNSADPTPLPSAPGSLFHDRPILRDGKLFFVSAHEPSDLLYKSWSAVYSAEIGGVGDVITRLTPKGVVDYSPAISFSGELMAVASYGSKPWGGEIHELDTDIVVFPISDPTKRTVLAKRGGWPTWAGGDSTIFFHRESDDGWWSIYRVNYPGESSKSPSRVTPPGLHAFTPAAFQDGKRIAVATRRKDSDFRHIEIFDVESGKFQPITKFLNPEIHHYNPFVSVL